MQINPLAPSPRNTMLVSIPYDLYDTEFPKEVNQA
jgi:hypothetical protein